MKSIFAFLALMSFVGCSSSEDRPRHPNYKGEYVNRSHHASSISIPPPQRQARPLYPWEEGLIGGNFKITKEFFRCKGSSLNPVRTVQKDSDIDYYYDCGGPDKHSLPIHDGKEFIYPILIDLLNHIQAQTKKRVVITCGHRCPEHNAYSDSSADNRYSKHMIGAEVSFYVQGMEDQPEAIVSLLQEYYTLNPEYGKEYVEFNRYEKQDTNVSTLPWYNKEVFIKLFQKDEGRNFDNRHPYPYIGIQVRYDSEEKKRVTYNWNQAYKGYQRK